MLLNFKQYYKLSLLQLRLFFLNFHDLLIKATFIKALKMQRNFTTLPRNIRSWTLQKRQSNV